jgi:MoaA/NifB/PqqE/SkfB family radical SAM enzyme
MKYGEILQAWGRILTGHFPVLSIEITRECPLRCPGCYAYEEAHLNNGTPLRSLQDYRGAELVQRVLALVEQYRPLHLSIVGGDPLVRHRELNALLPEVNRRGVFVQIVTSAFRRIPVSWRSLSRVNVVVSVDGLQPEHDARRKPATYETILKNIGGGRVIIHFTITGQMMRRAAYLNRFLEFWASRDEVKKIWVSIFTPQVGADLPECLSRAERDRAIDELLALRRTYSKLDMPESVIREFATPPAAPEQCIFAQTTKVFSADLRTEVTPCQFGGNPDCSRCGCVASMGMAAVSHRSLGFGITAGQLFEISAQIGRRISNAKASPRVFGKVAA